MGMSATAWDGWAQLHVNPYVAMGYYFVSTTLMTVTAAYMGTGIQGEGHIYYVALVSLVFNIIVCTAATIAFWRWGPAVAHHKLSQPALAIAGLCLTPMFYVGYLGPEATIPWHNGLQWLLVSGLHIFFFLQSASAGGMPVEHPAEPRTGIMEPVLGSALHALMMVDALSDLCLTRSLVEVVCFP